MSLSSEMLRRTKQTLLFGPIAGALTGLSFVTLFTLLSLLAGSLDVITSGDILSVWFVISLYLAGMGALTGALVAIIVGLTNSLRWAPLVSVITYFAVVGLPFILNSTPSSTVGRELVLPIALGLLAICGVLAALNGQLLKHLLQSQHSSDKSLHKLRKLAAVG